MPFTKKRYGTKKKWLKYKKCVREVTAEGKVRSPHAVCRAAIYKKPSKPKFTKPLIRCQQLVSKSRCFYNSIHFFFTSVFFLFFFLGFLGRRDYRMTNLLINITTNLLLLSSKPIS